MIFAVRLSVHANCAWMLIKGAYVPKQRLASCSACPGTQAAAHSRANTFLVYGTLLTELTL